MRDPRIGDVVTLVGSGLLVLVAGLWFANRNKAYASATFDRLASGVSISPGLARAVAPSWLSSSGSPDRVAQTPTYSREPEYLTNDGQLLPADLVVPDGRGGFVPMV